MAPGLALLPDSAGYRIYIESLFDELSTEVKVLFDRRDLASIIWPRRAAFEGLLSVLNAPELAAVWGEDETLGWVYQYFNSPEERRALREASQAPRNSRELAIRNQFFTPRYVVQFLTDNTLARIWYEMRGGETRLVERGEYLVRRANETRELRAKQDPRDLKILDPACGSGHFLLYSFDLLLLIYEEGWADPDAPPSLFTGQTLREDYPNFEELRRAIPGLILWHNLHGIDIDARCAQIAQLSLWMRAQRAFRDYGIARSVRPNIRRANTVIGEPMPGEADLLDEFLRNLKEDNLEGLLRRALRIPADRTVRATKAMVESLAELVTEVWTAMRLAGEVGSLLKIDRELESAIEKGRLEWEDRLPLFRVAEYGLEHGHLAAVKERYLRLVPGEQEDFWGKAEKLVFQALAEYTAAASGAGNARRRLFAEDAEQGFALSDLLTHKFDVILMNPPFGEVSIPSRTYLYSNYDNAAQDIYTAFVDSAVQRLSVGGKIGVLSSRLGFYQDLTEGWRDKLVNGAAPLQLFADLGEKVLDGALVEAAAYVLCKGKGTRAEFFDLLSVADKDSALREASKYEGSSASYAVDLSEFAHVPGHRVVYWVSNRWRRSFDSTTPLEEVLQFPRVGLQTGDDLRLLRLWWEAPQSAIGKRWIPFAKGGEYKCFFQPLDLVVNWSHSRSARRQSNSGAYFKPGITYTERTASDISFRFLPEGCIFSPNGVTVGPLEQAKALVGIVVLNTRVARLFIEMCVGSGGVLQPGGVARHYGPRIVAKVPVPTDLFVEDLEVRAHQIWRDFASRDALNETSLFFSGLLQEGSLSEGIEVTAKRQFEGEEEAWIRAIDISYVAEKRYLRALRMESADVVELDRIWGLHPGGLTSDGANGVVLGTDFARLYSLTVSDLIRELVKLKGASTGLTKCTFVADRRLELLAQYFGMHPSILVKKRRELGLLPDKLLVDFCKACLFISRRSCRGSLESQLYS
jgi:hypothetical protein